MDKKLTLRIEQVTMEEWAKESYNKDRKKTVISISTEKFDGPLDALYSMIMKHKIDITEISISDITKQFVQYIKALSTMELSGEFLDIISRLLFLKSSYLIKKNREAEELLKLKEEEAEIAKQLLEKLQVYRVYKNASDYLIQRSGIAQGSYFKNRPEIVYQEDFDLSSLTQNDLYKAILDISKLEQEKIEDNIKTRITNEKLDKIYKERFLRVEDQIENISKKLEVKSDITMTEIIKDLNKPSTIASFLALLEMMKAKTLHAEQEQPYEEIYIHKGPQIKENKDKEGNNE